MWALKVRRSMTAATSLGSVMIWFHSLKGRFEPIAIDDVSSRSVRTWNFVGYSGCIGDGVCGSAASERGGCGSCGELRWRLLGLGCQPIGLGLLRVWGTSASASLSNGSCPSDEQVPTYSAGRSLPGTIPVRLRTNPKGLHTFRRRRCSTSP